MRFRNHRQDGPWPVNDKFEALNPLDVAKVVTELSVLQYFPSDIDARAAIAKDLADICPNIHEARWLAKRMRQLFAEWPGPRELRAVYCSRNKPRDEIEAGSSIFPDGVPSPVAGSELAWYPAIESAPILQLPPGHVITADITLENDIRRLAAAKDLNRRKAEEVRNPDYKPITEADIQAALEENRDRHAREELLP